MCRHCNYPELLRTGGLEPTANRLNVLAAIGNHPSPIGAPEIFRTVARIAPIDRVTVYRILERLVEKELVERLGGAGRGRLYGLAPNANHPAHPHFSCRRCGATYCLRPLSRALDLRELVHSPAGEILKVEVRISGVCRSCLGRRKGSPASAMARSDGPEGENGC